MATVKATLLKPLDGFAEGSIREFDQVDFDRLHALHAVAAVKADPAPMAPSAPATPAPARGRPARN